MKKDNEMKIEFAEGCFDNFNGTQEELAELLADLHQMVNDGTLMENSTPLSPEDEAEFIELMQKKLPRQ
jgi:hypothetical protein